jgi:hypothetical protein
MAGGVKVWPWIGRGGKGMAYTCQVCGREYKTRGGLSRHVERAHPSKESGSKVRAAGAEDESQGRVKTAPLFAGLEQDAARLEEACQALGVALGDVMSYRLYDDRVVIIEGPVGYKRVYEVKGTQSQCLGAGR